MGPIKKIIPQLRHDIRCQENCSVRRTVYCLYFLGKVEPIGQSHVLAPDRARSSHVILPSAGTVVQMLHDIRRDLWQAFSGGSPCFWGPEHMEGFKAGTDGGM